MNYDVDRFSILLKMFLEARQISIRELDRILHEKCIDITYRSLYRYWNDEAVPTFVRAKLLLKAISQEMAEEIDDSELRQLLEESKFSVDKKEKFIFQKTVRIKKEDFIELEDRGIELEEIEELIRERMKVLYGKETFSNYVKDLIIQDLIDNMGKEN